YDYYEEKRIGLGDEFAQEVYSAINRILAHPNAWTRLSSRTRRCRTKRFHYGVVYQIRTEGILIVAVMHLSRKPGYWENRLKRKDERTTTGPANQSTQIFLTTDPAAAGRMDTDRERKVDTNYTNFSRIFLRRIFGKKSGVTCPYHLFPSGL